MNKGQQKAIDTPRPMTPEELSEAFQNRYRPELWTVKKDTIYKATAALELALGYVEALKSTIPAWEHERLANVAAIKFAIAELQREPQGRA